MEKKVERQQVKEYRVALQRWFESEKLKFRKLEWENHEKYTFVRNMQRAKQGIAPMLE